MKSFILTILVVLFSTILYSCQSSSTAEEIKPQKVYKITHEQRSDQWYRQQAELWKQELAKNPKNEEAWENYYYAARYESFVASIKTKSRKEKLANIIAEMEKAIPNTYTYYLLKAHDKHDLNDISMLEKAYLMNPDRPETYTSFISYYETHGNEAKSREFCSKLYTSRDISPWLYNYNYNVLMSLEPNAVIITNGDNDTYPAWILQKIKNIRTDVIVLNLSLATVEKYFNDNAQKHGWQINHSELMKKAKEPGTLNYGKFINALVNAFQNQHKEVPLYFALTVYSEYTKNISDFLYITGLAFKYSPNRIDNIALIKNNLQNRLHLDHLKHDWYREDQLGIESMHRLNMNYIAPMILLAEHFKAAGEKEETAYWRNFALYLAEQAGNEKAIKEIKNKKL